MESVRKAVCVFISILFGSSLLSGANVMFEGFYKLPEDISKFLVMLIVFLYLVDLSLKATSKKRGNK